jgi:SAM-dependent methyltransferase
MLTLNPAMTSETARRTRSFNGGMTDHGDQRRWDDPDHARDYLAHRQEVPHRGEGEAVLVDALGAVDRVLDLGAGDGRLLALVLDANPGASGVALDHNPAMLEAADARFGALPEVAVIDHDLDGELPGGLGPFDAVVSALALHHFTEQRRRALSSEVLGLLRPGGVFADLDLVRSASEALHDRFVDRVPWDRDPSLAWDRHPSLDERMAWLADAGFVNVDCLWKWRELALVTGERPPAGT